MPDILTLSTEPRSRAPGRILFSRVDGFVHIVAFLLYATFLYATFLQRDPTPQERAALQQILGNSAQLPVQIDLFANGSEINALLQ